jgi:pseudouridine synthase
MALDDGERLQPAEIKVREQGETRSVFHITIYEGKNRQIRRMCEQLGLTVKLLKRESIGNLRLGNIKPGQTRFLSDDEINYIKSL